MGVLNFSKFRSLPIQLPLDATFVGQDDRAFDIAAGNRVFDRLVDAGRQFDGPLDLAVLIDVGSAAPLHFVGIAPVAADAYGSHTRNLPKGDFAACFWRAGRVNAPVRGDPTFDLRGR